MKLNENNSTYYSLLTIVNQTKHSIEDLPSSMSAQWHLFIYHYNEISSAKIRTVMVLSYPGIFIQTSHNI